MAESDSPPVLPEDDLPIRLVLLDVNGTLLDEQGKLFPETQTALQTLRKHVPAVRFLSNDSDIGASAQLQRLRAAGLEIADNEFVSSLTLAKTFVKVHKLRPLLLLSAAAATDFACVDQKQPNCVIVGDSPEHFSYEKLNEAFRVIASSVRDSAVTVVYISGLERPKRAHCGRERTNKSVQKKKSACPQALSLQLSKMQPGSRLTSLESHLGRFGMTRFNLQQ
eukprot:GHVN01018223.1.p1 GENE.GHVN01018223.1~~GHVN01018223.1.p1  ORF type:complete len:223 (+),score=20.15 GHVN01018223.1:86-754(+)